MKLFASGLWSSFWTCHTDFTRVGVAGDVVFLREELDNFLSSTKLSALTWYNTSNTKWSELILSIYLDICRCNNSTVKMAINLRGSKTVQGRYLMEKRKGIQFNYILIEKKKHWLTSKTLKTIYVLQHQIFNRNQLAHWAYMQLCYNFL